MARNHLILQEGDVFGSPALVSVTVSRCSCFFKRYTQVKPVELISPHLGDLG